MKEKNKGGRPRIEIKKKEFENLCKLQCTVAEIAGFFNCSSDTIERWVREQYGKPYSEVFETKRVGGLISLRRSQFQLAHKNATMAIWLGKQYLGQKDEQTINQNIAPVIIKEDLDDD